MHLYELHNYAVAALNAYFEVIIFKILVSNVIFAVLVLVLVLEGSVLVLILVLEGLVLVLVLVLEGLVLVLVLVLEKVRTCPPLAISLYEMILTSTIEDFFVPRNSFKRSIITSLYGRLIISEPEIVQKLRNVFENNTKC